MKTVSAIKDFLVSVGVRRLVRHRARFSAAAAIRAIVFLAARVRILAALGFLLAAIHRARFATAFSVAAGLCALITVLRGSKSKRGRRNRQTPATYDCDYEGFHSSHF
jgi:uncharacterized membrane protein